MKYLTLNEWKKREFARAGWDNRTIKRMISSGIFVGILAGNKTLIREDQTLAQLDQTSVDLEMLIRESA